MMKRSMILAAGLVASLAFAGQSFAGTVLVDFTVTGGTATDVTLIYAAPVTSASIVSSTGIGTPMLTGVGTTTLEITFGTASAAGSVLLSESGPAPAFYGLSGLSAGYKSSSVTITPASVPEPASLALLGIGMTSFLAFRRFFNKRNPVA
jgi:hypothetical protein